MTKNQRWIQKNFARRVWHPDDYWFAPNREGKHGKIVTYASYGCHCPPCREVQNAKKREFRANYRKNRVVRNGRWYALGREGKHGMSTTYHTYGCRCDPCSENAAEQRRKKREKVGL